MLSPAESAPVSVVTELMVVLGQLTVSGVDVQRLSAREVETVLVEVRRAQRVLDGLVMGLGARSTELAAEGRSGTATEMLRGDGVVGSCQARREAARADTIVELPKLAAAVSAGVVSGEHVDSVARHLSKVPQDQRAELSMEKIVAKAGELPVETFDRFMRHQVDRIAGARLADTTAKRRASEFRHWFDDTTGMGRFAGSLDPERYETLVNAVEQKTVELAGRQNEPLTANLAAAALVELTQTQPGSMAARPSITVVVDHDTVVHGQSSSPVCETEHGRAIPAETVARLCCDAVIRRVLLDNRGVPIDVGRKYRTATDAQWAAIKATHPSCAWDGCTAPISWCQAHHIRPWEQGGPTDLENLVPLCTEHHHRVHEGGWHIKLKPDRSLEIRRPDGTHTTTTPTPQRC